MSEADEYGATVMVATTRQLIGKAMQVGTDRERVAIASGALEGYVTIVASSLHNGKRSREEIAALVRELLSQELALTLPRVLDAMNVPATPEKAGDRG